MQFLEIFIYSLIQGLTEFLPISSSAHLYFLEEVFHWTNKTVLYALAAHLGTLIAVLYYQRNNIYILLKNSLYFKDEFQYLICILISSFPVIFIGAIASLFFSNVYDSILIIIGTASIIGGVFLDISDNYKPNKKSNSKITYKIAILTGLFQTLALIPGMSRSGTVITALRICSINRYESIKFSLLTGIPILIVASLYSIYKLTELDRNISYTFFFISFISFTSALFSIKFILSWIKRYSFRLFAIYRIIFGLVIYMYLIY